jgi:hypothetical protein
MGTDDLFRIRKAGRERRRGKNLKLRAKAWLIVCEGEKTEPNYFKGLMDWIYSEYETAGRLNLTIKGCGKNTTSLVRSCESYFEFADELYGSMKIPFGNIIFVFDRDSFGEARFNEAVRKAKQYEKEKGVEKAIVAWSNESFELWLNLHFNLLRSSLNRNALNDKLTDIFRKGSILSKGERFENEGKNRDSIFKDILQLGGEPADAIRSARELDKIHTSGNFAQHNPSTKMYLAVEALFEAAGLEIFPRKPECIENKR